MMFVRKLRHLVRWTVIGYLAFFLVLACMWRILFSQDMTHQLLPIQDSNIPILMRRRAELVRRSELEHNDTSVFQIEQKVAEDLLSKPNVSSPIHDMGLFRIWQKGASRSCAGNFIGYGALFASLHELLIDLDKCPRKRNGGEEIEAVLNQQESIEYFTYNTGCFQMQCKDKPTYSFKWSSNPQTRWVRLINIYDQTVAQPDLIVSRFTLAVVRYEYVNLFHTMTDWYNAFLVMRMLNKTETDTNVIFVDTHPRGSLDSVWSVLFNSTARLSTFPTRTLFRNIAWNIMGYNSFLLEFNLKSIPLTEEFRTFVLSGFNIKTSQILECKRVNILIILRKDYVAHPRNPKGGISRQITNEQQIIMALKKEYPNFKVTAIQIDILNMTNQLNLVANTDILIGMHGAGLSHTMLLPKHAALIELYPNYWSSSNKHFASMAKWRNLSYFQWENQDPHNEIPGNKFTIVPPNVVLTLVKKALNDKCSW